MIAMKNIAVIAYSLTIEYTLTIAEGINQYFKNKDDVNLVFIPAKHAHSKDFGYDYQYWTAVNLLNSRTLDAVIVIVNSFLGLVTLEQLSESLKFLSPIPIICVSTPLNIPNVKYTCVQCDKAYDQVVDHLVKKHNRKNFAFFSAGLTSVPESLERENAFKQAVKNHNLKVDESLIFQGDFTPKVCYDFIKANYKNKSDIPFDALLCANDYMAAGCIGALQEIGVSVPDDVCIVGFDDSEAALSCKPTISTIKQQVDYIGYKSAEIAYKIVNGENVPEKTVIDCFPIYRQSCGCVPKDSYFSGYINQDGEQVDPRKNTTSLDIFGNGLNGMESIFNHLNMADSVTNMDSFVENTKSTLEKLHIPLFGIFVYDEPVTLNPEDDFKTPSSAKLLVHIDTNKSICRYYSSDETETFNPQKSLLPSFIEIPQNGNYLLIPVFLRELNYGYMFLKLPTTRFPLYIVFFKIIANLLVHAYQFSKTEKEKEQLFEKNQNLDFATKTDDLTLLFNRRGFMEYGQRLIESTAKNGQSGSVFFCDLDGLKNINDTWGHEMGDLAIKTEAKVLKAVFRETDLIGRLSGDEFGVVAPNFPLRKLETLRKRLKTINKQYSKNAKLPFILSISIGVAEYNSPTSSLTKLLTLADNLLYEEKKLKHPEREYNR